MMTIKKSPIAFIMGITGQDGALLANSLLNRGYVVYGGYRRGINKTWRLDYLKITSKVNLIECQLNETQYLIETLQSIKPNEFYNLAGDSFVADSFKHPGMTLTTNTLGTINILEAVKLVTPSTRMFFASSSEIFGANSHSGLLDETSLKEPNNPYAISKLSADYFVKLYREKYSLFACSGILFNHEGPLRGGQFVSRKITSNIARMQLKGGVPIELGNLNSARDWGAAVDYVEAMRLMLNIDEPKDYVIASGKLSTVRDILRLSAIAAGFEPIFEGENKQEICVDKVSGNLIAKVSEQYFRPHDTSPLVGDSTKIKVETGWEKTRSFEQMINEMVLADLERWESGVLDI